MNTYSHILLAIDYSAHSQIVAERAVQLMQQHNAKLSVIHVLDNIPMPDTSYGTIISFDSETDYMLLETEKVKLTQFGETLNIPEENRWLIWGSPKKEIVELADKENVDLIVMGSNGRHGLALLLGSTASGVLHYAKCDVLAVRLQDE